MKRPAEFDARVLEWLPLLRQRAYRYERNAQDREDLIQDTIAGALRRWESFREDGSFGTWLVFQMRGEIHTRRRKKRPEGKPLANDDEKTEAPLILQPTQESVADARIALAALNDNRADRMLVRLAMGETGQEVGDSVGLSRERVRQVTCEARYHFGRRIGKKVDANGMAITKEAA